MRCLELSLLVVLLLPPPVPASHYEIVKSWATGLGDELWKLSLALTKSDQIRSKYKQMNASVKKKDGEQILYSSLRSVSTMLTRKINAVKCIHATAERLAREFNSSEYQMNAEGEITEFEYCSAKYSNFTYEDGFEGPADVSETPLFAINNSHYLPVSLERDSHFYDIFVNTNLSCVHVPTNIYYREPDALEAILWSKDLNEVFIKNYQADPSLSWQYFGSSHGILRFYPGMPWNKIEVDTYDCRVKSWYIEAATCTKDVIILFDVSGSMTGFKNYVARRTLKSLLSTLSNNDYVIVYTYKKETENVVPCFDDLVQATPENIKAIEEFLEPVDNVHRVSLDGNANLTQAYQVAFNKLKERRHSKNCTVQSLQGCNQLVMLITDYVPGNLTEVFEEHNRVVVDDKVYTPVRVFTFLIGKEVTNVDEIRWMACLNRGYFVHIHSVEEVQQQVLKYINVIARPMILKGDEPQPTWTHANIDPTRTKYWNVSGTDLSKPDEDKLVTSVAIPAFDYKHNENSNDAILLGVAGTDVPIDSIAKLAQPHQLGVNGYPLIVSNNGYLLLHPLLITSINGQLQENYNSVDFVEVEQVDDGKGSRELGDKIKELRKKLVNAETGNMTNIEVLFHYDDMRRIARVKHDYFFNELKGTPFAMGISLPRGYGDTELLLKDNPLEAKQGQDVTGINVTDYFRFNYRIHPDWVYCKYHYLEGHEASNPEIEIWNFLVLLSKNKIDISRQQYEEEEKNFTVSTHCDNRQPLEKDDYYCTEDLVKQLVFDAKLTTPFFEDWRATDSERDLAKKYNVNVRFIATASGLTRWHYIDDDEKNEYVDDNGNRKKTYDGNVFGDKYHNAIEETWYKAAVLQHVINKESLVVSTKLPILDDTIINRPEIVDKDGNITVTASYAIFYKDGNSETPASVVGFEYSYRNFQERFIELTNKFNDDDDDDGDEFACGEKYNCFVIDSSGYVVLSVPLNVSQVGQFFGEVNDDTGYVMSYLEQYGVFNKVEVFNYQALCPSSLLEKNKPKSNRGFSLLTPLDIAKNLIRWLISELALLMMNWNEYAYASDTVVDYSDEDIEEGTSTTPPPQVAETSAKNKKPAEKTFSCDHSITLYILNQTRFRDSMGSSEIMFKDEKGDCHPAFWASFVTKTNLLLVVVEKENSTSNDYATHCHKVPSTKPVPTSQSTTSSEPCHKLPLGNLTRRKLEGCYTYHEKERNITACGLGNIARMDMYLLLTTVLMAALTSFS